MSFGHTKESHKITRTLQRLNHDTYHHPKEKLKQLNELKPYIHGNILEVFAGQGNLTEFYKEHGKVTPMTQEETGSSFDAIYKLRSEKKKFDVIDIDSYGYPDKFFPIVFELMHESCLLIFTFPIVGVNCLNGIIEQHFLTFYKNIPSIGDVCGVITDLALREWILPQLIDIRKIKRIYRFAFLCSRKKSTEMCFVRNRADAEYLQILRNGKFQMDFEF